MLERKRGLYNPNKIEGFGHSMVNKLKSHSRQRRKRDKSKHRRSLLRQELENEIDEN